MPASAEYLTKYLSASGSKASNTNQDYDDNSSRPKKRRKKDRHATTSTLLIADDDADLLLSSSKHKSGLEDDEDGPLLYDTRTRSAEFRKKKTSTWQTVQDTEPQRTNGGTDAAASRATNVDDGDEADAILAATAVDSDRRREAIEAEDAPAVVEFNDSSAAPRMASGARAGLQTAADTAAIMAAEETRADEEQRKARKKKKTSETEPAQEEEETIYRDATGRRIDVSMRRAEARKEELARVAAERKERESAMGEVQLRQREQAKQDLEEAKFLTLGRTADDEDMNERMREEVRWDDPMAQYMAERKAEKDAEGSAAARRGGRGVRRGDADGDVVKLKRKAYAGAAPPNRYGIKPGWRWDGVARGNGFEKEWFQARGRKTRNENLEYQWAMDE